MYDFTDNKKAIKFWVYFTLKTPLIIRSGFEGEFADAALQKTPDERYLLINGYVWASLLRRAMMRLKNCSDITSKISSTESEKKISPFWFNSSIVSLDFIDVRSGIKIDRQYGTAETRALYVEENLPSGFKIPLQFVYFCKDSDLNRVKDSILKSLWIVDQGIENIGGEWSYGCGRLKIDKIAFKEFDLLYAERDELFTTTEPKDLEWTELSKFRPTNNEIANPWKHYLIKAKILDGQLLAIHSKTIPLVSDIQGEMPDSFVFRTLVKNGDSIESQFVITGKALRQTLFSMTIERELRSRGSESKLCLTPADYCTCEECKKYREERDEKKGNSPNCQCLRCLWFGSSESSGIISVSDAFFDTNSSNQPKRVLLRRIQLCEHSFQNINLFTSEYLTKGSFSFDIWIDFSRKKSKPEELDRRIKSILTEIREKKCPPGWYRLGATSTSTGQFDIEKFEENFFGEGERDE